MSVAMTMLHEQLRQRFPTALWQGDPARREIALTYDDGPDPKATPDLLAILDRYGVTATFFQIGQRATRAPHIVQQVASAGHQIGLHGYNHQSFLLKRAATLRNELAQAQRVIADASGRDRAALNAVRPPFGHFTPATLRSLQEWSYLPTMWSLVPFHWRKSAEATIQQVITGVHDGTILVLHEGLSGPAAADLTQAVLPSLLADGYRFITINEMWAKRQQNIP